MNTAEEKAEQEKDNINLALIIFSPAIFGLVGGFAIDKNRKVRTAIKTGAGLVLAAMLTAVVVSAVLALFRDAPHSVSQLSIALFWFVFGWWLGLLLHPASETMLTVGAQPEHVSARAS